MDGDVNFQSLDSLPLEIGRSEIHSLFSPFARRLDDDDWRWKRELWRRRRRIAKRLLRDKLKRHRSGPGRKPQEVLQEYAKAWSRNDYGIYDPAATARKLTPWRFGRDRYFASDVGATRFRQLLLKRVIERYRPNRVLEVGCGNGINLFLAAGCFPSVEFTGLELTQAGLSAARILQRQYDTLPEALQRFMPEPPLDPGAFRRVRFVRGNAGALPFRDASFDLVYSMLALEQMEALRTTALAEISRVSGGFYFGIEPFREANAGGWRRLYVLQRGYFQGSLRDLPAYGLRPDWSTMDFPQEVFLGVCAVLAHKVPAARAEAAG